jgi:hypothetical protein
MRRFWGRRRSDPGDLANRICPYLVTEEYPDVLSTPTQAQRTIGHGLSVALVSPHRSSGVPLVGAVGTTQLQTSGLDLDTAYAHAERNLSQMLSSAQMALEFFEHGPAGAPTVVVRGHVLAAATLVAPGLRDRVTQLLGDDIVAAVPHQELLFLFGPAATAVMGDFIDAEFHATTKPLTTGLFTLGDGGPSARQ